MPVQRIDVVEVPEWLSSKFELTSDGFLKGRAACTNIGVFTYRRGDGTIVRELRTPEEVFHPDSVATLKMRPITLNHPKTPDGTKFISVTTDNVDELAVGMTGTNVIEGDKIYLSVDMAITNKEAIEEVYKGKQGLSCGYSCDLEPQHGRYLGMEYDAVQRNIRYNHIALVDAGRAGETARIRVDHLDALDAVLIDKVEDKEEDMPDKTDELEQKVTALEQEKATLTSRIDALTAEISGKTTLESERDTFKEKVDQLTADLEAKKDFKYTEADFVAKVNARIALLDKAHEIGAETKADQADVDIKKAVIMKVFPKAALEGKSDAYIDARYDLALEEFTVQDDADAATRQLATDSAPTEHADEVDSEKAHKAYIDRLVNKK